MSFKTTSYESLDADKALIRSLSANDLEENEEVVAWLNRRNREVKVQIDEIPFQDMKGWHFDSDTGDLRHDSGRFFSVVGADVYANTGTPHHWRQPLINQPEVGYLGIVAKEIDGVLRFLMQAKIEPGNVNCVQLSPTLQATRSNYMQVHGGRKPAYLDYFKDIRPAQIILDQLQSEQGARFYRKRNRNIIIRVDDDVDVGEDFRWLTLGQIKSLMSLDNTVNMDARTVLSGLRIPVLETSEEDSGSSAISPFGRDLLESERHLSGRMTIDDVLYKLTELKSRYELITEKIPLKDVTDWRVTDSEIVRPDRKFFRVMGVKVTIENREVSSWCQPLVQPMQEGICVLFARKINGVLHFLLQAKVECGNFDVVELAPTIQCLTGNFRTATILPPFVKEFVEGTIHGETVFDTRQSEEGGRFFHEQNRNVIFVLHEEERLTIPENFIWLTLGQIKEFLRFNNYLNIQVRSLISSLNYV